MDKKAKNNVTRRSFIGLLAAAAAFLLARIPWPSRQEGLKTARFWRRLGGKRPRAPRPPQKNGPA
ncbi:MAG: twin-arginine translocation signal domain-containing protein [candidate division Zixibacteria bacterium]|nr:twin-arginine translocation signal domain-containing protein [candidate division Zixibacteria bacterium]